MSSPMSVSEKFMLMTTQSERLHVLSSYFLLAIIRRISFRQNVSILWRSTDRDLVAEPFGLNVTPMNNLINFAWQLSF